jgi:hypothetical protein
VTWWKLRRIQAATPKASEDAEIARLTARADLIVEQLDDVVKEMSAMLHSAYEGEK